MTRCHYCGCTPAEPCELAHKWPHGRPYADPARRAASVVDVRQTCTLYGGVCSRCHAPGRPTDRQAGELLRIRFRHPAARIVFALEDHRLVVEIPERARTVLLDP